MLKWVWDGGEALGDTLRGGLQPGAHGASGRGGRRGHDRVPSPPDFLSPHDPESAIEDSQVRNRRSRACEIQGLPGQMIPFTRRVSSRPTIPLPRLSHEEPSFQGPAALSDPFRLFVETVPGTKCGSTLPPVPSYTLRT